MKQSLALLLPLLAHAALQGADIAPIITRQPVSQVGQRLGSVTFTAIATGSLPLTYQWRRDGNAWAGWNKPSITLEGLSENDVGVYVLTVTNSAGAVNSEGAALSLGPPLIGRHPASKGVSVGERVTLSVDAAGLPPLSYQWKKKTTDVPGATGATLTFSALKQSDYGSYTVVVRNAQGAATSKPAVLAPPGELPPEPAPPKPPPPLPTPPPAEAKASAPKPPEIPPVSAAAGKTITLSATAEGSPPFKFQWLKNGQPISGATQVSLELHAVKPADAGLYICIVSNAAGTTRSPPFNLTVSAP